MKLSDEISGVEQELIDLCTAPVAASEGAEQGTLVREAIFSRMTDANDPCTEFLTVPVATAIDRQCKASDHSFLRHLRGELRAHSVDVAMNNVSSACHGKAAIAFFTKAKASAPLSLGHTEGWIGQAMSRTEWTPLFGPCAHVAGPNDPVF